MRFHTGQAWKIHSDPTINRYTVEYDDGASSVWAYPHDINGYGVNSGSGCPASSGQIQIENLYAYVAVTSITHVGGKIGVVLYDLVYPDNIPGCPNPTFGLAQA